MVPIYQDIDDVMSPVAPTAAAAITVEFGKALLWTIIILIAVAMTLLLRAALRRGRDSFYPAAGASCLVVLLLQSFGDTGLFGTAVSIIGAAMLGLAVVQSKSRTLQ
jgi:hypothetical protein